MPPWRQAHITDDFVLSAVLSRKFVNVPLWPWVWKFPNPVAKHLSL